jgi:hypothetical protein
MRWLGVFIAPNHFLAVGKGCWRWAHRTVQWRTRQTLFTVRCTPRRVSVRVWRSWSLEALVVLLHRTVRCHTGQSGVLWLLSSDFCTALFITVHLTKRSLARRESLLRWHTRQSSGTQDSPVNYSGVRLQNSREWPVRWVPGRAPFSSILYVLLQFLDWVPNWISFLVCVEPYAPEINDI